MGSMEALFSAFKNRNKNNKSAVDDGKREKAGVFFLHSLLALIDRKMDNAIQWINQKRD